MRGAQRALAVVAAAAFTSALATPSVAHAGAGVALTTLPDGGVPFVPEGPAPPRIGATAQVAGLSVRAPTFHGKRRLAPPRSMPVQVTAEGPVEENAPVPCILDTVDVSEGFRRGGDGRHGDEDFRDQSSTSAMLQRQVTDGNQGASRAASVQAVRVERLLRDTPGAERAVLDVLDVWVDPVTQGARLARHVTIPLLRVGRGPGGTFVYATRAGDRIDVIVETPRDESSISITEGSGGSSSSSCGHARFRLHVTRGEGAMTTVEGVLPFGAPKVPSPATGTDEAIAANPNAKADTETNESESEDEVSLRRRFRLGISATWLPSASEPTLSVASAWIGKPNANL